MSLSPFLSWALVIVVCGVTLWAVLRVDRWLWIRHYEHRNGDETEKYARAREAVRRQQDESITRIGHKRETSHND